MQSQAEVTAYLESKQFTAVCLCKAVAYSSMSLRAIMHCNNVYMFRTTEARVVSHRLYTGPVNIGDSILS